MKKSARVRKESFFEPSKAVKNVVDEVKEVIQEEKVVLKPQKKIFQRKSVQLSAFIVMFVIIGVLVYLQVTNLKDVSVDQAKLSADQVKSLVLEIGEKMILPEGETPTVATVTDVTKLAAQPFFKNAQNGDKVVIYGSTKEAILYRSSIHKIVAVAPINTTDPQAVSTTPSLITTGTPNPSISPSPTPKNVKVKVLILNSTKEVGLAKKGAALLDPEKFEITTANAQGEYDKSTVSQVVKDNKLSNSDLKGMVSRFTKAKPTVVSLPSKEIVPEGVEVVIILGNDFSEAY